MKKLNYILALFVLTFTNAYALNLAKGVSLINGMFSEAEEEFSWSLDDLSPNHDVINRGYTNLGSGSSYYALYSDMNIRFFNMSDNKYLEGSPLTRTPSDQKEAVEQFFKTNMRFSDDEYDLRTGNYNEPALGCLWDAPLRYGDIEQDATKELVLLLGYDATDKINRQLDIIIFSPQQQKVIFSSRLAREDIGPLVTEAYPNYIRQDNPGHLPKTGSSDTSGGIGNAAIRVYSKLYTGDFNKNDKPDILVWRKRYYSKTIEDPVPGYAIRKELLTHYELDNGMYTAQPTGEVTIKEWLTTNNLTWQKGYPSQSECPGQENQLIPEMHDPLLNDADVLK